MSFFFLYSLPDLRAVFARSWVCPSPFGWKRCTSLTKLRFGSHTCLEGQHPAAVQETVCLLLPYRSITAGLHQLPFLLPGVVLNATFKNSSDLKFQDSLGETFVLACKSIPSGVLAFFPSYCKAAHTALPPSTVVWTHATLRVNAALLDKVVNRWRETGLFSELEKCKLVLIEPRTSAKEFEKLRKKYNAALEPDRV